MWPTKISTTHVWQITLPGGGTIFWGLDIPVLLGAHFPLLLGDQPLLPRHSPITPRLERPGLCTTSCWLPTRWGVVPKIRCRLRCLASPLLSPCITDGAGHTECPSGPSSVHHPQASARFDLGLLTGSGWGHDMDSIGTGYTPAGYRNTMASVRLISSAPQIQ